MVIRESEIKVLFWLCFRSLPLIEVGDKSCNFSLPFLFSSLHTLLYVTTHKHYTRAWQRRFICLFCVASRRTKSNSHTNRQPEEKTLTSSNLAWST